MHLSKDSMLLMTTTRFELAINKKSKECTYQKIKHPLRLRVDLIWGEMEERDSQVLVCALATLDRRIALGEQLMVGFCKVGKARSARKFWRVTRN